MTTEERREKIKKLLLEADSPLSASNIANIFGVSRQIIVGDIALLRASGCDIIATPRGYVMENNNPQSEIEKTIVCSHNDDEMMNEIYTILDLGGALIDVTVEHSVYGEICAPLHIFSRFDADAFYLKIQNSGARPLCDLTGGMHLHKIRCCDIESYNRIISALKEKGILVPM
ncbi:MAG: transcription repressor NadR [Oscillospiraceae bacterium]